MFDDLSPDAVSLARALMRLAAVPGRLQVTVDVSPYPGRAWAVEISRVERLQVLAQQQEKARKKPNGR